MGSVALALISNSLVALVLCGVAEVAWRLRRPALAHAVWVLALIKLLTPAVWEVRVPSVSRGHEVEDTSIANVQVPVVLHGEVSKVVPTAKAFPAAKPAVLTRSWRWNWNEGLIAVWVCGSAGIALVAVARIRKFQRIVRDSALADGGFSAEIRRVAGRLGIARVAGARIVDADLPPMVWFLGIRPILLFGRGVLEIESDRREAIVAHELAHIRRGDHWVRLLELLATIVLWWHPLVWLARYRLREAEEEACDAWVVWAMPAARREYADVLVDLARGIWGRIPRAPADWVGLEFCKGDWS